MPAERPHRPAGAPDFPFIFEGLADAPRRAAASGGRRRNSDHSDKEEAKTDQEKDLGGAANGPQATSRLEMKKKNSMYERSPSMQRKLQPGQRNRGSMVQRAASFSQNVRSSIARSLNLGDFAYQADAEGAEDAKDTDRIMEFEYTHARRRSSVKRGSSVLAAVKGLGFEVGPGPGPDETGVGNPRKSTAPVASTVDDILKRLEKSASGMKFNPLSGHRVSWDWFVCAWIIWDILVIPWSIAYSPARKCQADSALCLPSWMMALDIVLYVVYWADIWVHFRTGYVDEQYFIVMNLRKIALRYVNEWFWVDLLTALPLYEATGILELRLIKLAKVVKLAKLQKHIDRNLWANWYRLFRVLATLILVGHWLGCIYWYIGVKQVEHVENMGCNAHTGCPWILEYDLVDTDPFTQYSSALYWGMTMLTAVEFGYVSPHTNYERFYAWICQTIGAVACALIFGYVTALITNLDGPGAQFRRLMDMTNTFLKFHKMPVEIADRVRSSVEYKWGLNVGVNRTEILQSLPDGLRTEVLMHIQEPIINKCPLFKHTGRTFISEMVRDMDLRAYLPSEIVFEAGSTDRDLYFVSRGQLQVFKAVKKKIKQIGELKEGDYFGEIAFFTGQRRGSTVRAYTYSEVYVIISDKLEPILLKFPEYIPMLMRDVKEYAKNNYVNYDAGSAEAKKKMIKKSGRRRSFIAKSSLGMDGPSFGIGGLNLGGGGAGGGRGQGAGGAGAFQWDSASSSQRKKKEESKNKIQDLMLEGDIESDRLEGIGEDLEEEERAQTPKSFTRPSLPGAGEDELVDQVEALPARIKRRSAAKIAPSPNIGGQEGDAPSSPREVEELKAKIRMLEATLHGHDSDDESMRT